MLSTALSLLLLVLPQQGRDVICAQETAVSTVCPNCPGNSPCLCVEFYGQWICPTFDIACHSRKGLTSGPYIMHEIEMYCYSQRNCTPPEGGCEPYFHPCIKDDGITQVGSFQSYQIVSMECAKS
jgi:hypothetical protein